MSMWLELHCDVKHDPEGWRDSEQCASFAGRYPDGMTANRAERVAATAREIQRGALAAGWTRFRKDGRVLFACPFCSSFTKAKGGAPK